MAFSVNLVITFILVPLMLRYLGPTGFGAWAIVRVFVGYASISDLGLPTAITKYVAEYTATGEHLKMARVLRAAFMTYAIAAVVIVLVVFLFQDFWVHTFFSSSGEYLGDIPFVLIGSLLVFSLNLIFSVFPMALNGIERMDLTNTNLAVQYVLNGALMYCALVWEMGLRGLVVANAIATVVVIGLNGFFFFRHFKAGWITRVKISLKELKGIFVFSGRMLTGSVASLVHLHFDKLLLSSFLNLTFVSSYEVSSRIVQQARQIPVLVLNPILPVASQLKAKGRSTEVAQLYGRSMKYLILLILPLFTIPALYAKEFIPLWIGHEDDLIVVTLQFFLFSHGMNLLTGPGFFIALGLGKSQYPMYSALVGLFLNVLLSIVLVMIFGYYGAVIGSFSSLIIASLYFLGLIHRDLGISWTLPLLLIWKPALSLVLSLAIVWLLGGWMNPGWARLLILGAASAGCYGLGVILFRAVDAEDKAFLKKLVAQGLQRMRQGTHAE